MGVGWSTVDPATIKTHRLKSVLLKDMFELLFKYPRAVFAKGTLVLLGAWPWWVFVLLVLAVAVNFAYDYAQEKVGRREVEIQKLKAIKPLYYEGEPMTREWARKAMKNREYMGHWYECLGEGAVTVFLWFVL